MMNRGIPRASVHLLRALVGAVRHVEQGPGRLLERVALTERALDDEALLLSREDERRLVESAIELTGAPAFGLRWASLTDFTDWGAVFIVLAYAQTYCALVDVLDRYSAVFTDGIVLSTHDLDDALAIRLQIAPEKPRVLREVYSEFILSFLRDAAVSFAGHAHPVRRVAFEYPAPADVHAYGNRFGCVCEFGAPRTELVLDASVGGARRRMRESAVLRTARDRAEECLGERDAAAGFELRVRDFLERSLPTERNTLDAARSLGVSTRSLRRHLRHEGAEWQLLVREAKASEAKALLRNLKVREVAERLGFANPSAFHRAFKSWTGMRPASFRRK